MPRRPSGRCLVQVLPAPPEARGYDLTKLRTLARGREEFVVKIIHSFLRNIPDSLAQLQAAAAIGNWGEVAKITHHIKPSLESVGVPRVAEAVRQLEAATLEDYPHLPAAAAHLATQVQLALAQLPRELGE
jgi:HPt (histidine-containing phosphotransfer) domain-containing protein